MIVPMPGRHENAPAMDLSNPDLQRDRHLKMDKRHVLLIGGLTLSSAAGAWVHEPAHDVLDKEQEAQLRIMRNAATLHDMKARGRNKRDAPSAIAALWPEGKVYYQYDGATEETKEAVARAMRIITDKTAVRFVYNVNPDPSLRRDQYLNITTSYDAPHVDCGNSRVGMQAVQRNAQGQATGQKLNISFYCQNTGVALHELVHALGFHHEQLRPDRGAHLAGDSRLASVMIGIIPEDIYDFDSIMHYEARPEFGIAPRDPEIDPSRLGQRKTLSAGDIAMINRAYPPGGGWDRNGPDAPQQLMTRDEQGTQCLEAQPDRALVKMAPCASAPAAEQRWKFETGQLKYQATQPTLCLGTSTTLPGVFGATLLSLTPCNGSDSQRWRWLGKRLINKARNSNEPMTLMRSDRINFPVMSFFATRPLSAQRWEWRTPD